MPLPWIHRRHCARSEAIHRAAKAKMVASSQVLLAMRGGTASHKFVNPAQKAGDPALREIASSLLALNFLRRCVNREQDDQKSEREDANQKHRQQDWMGDTPFRRLRHRVIQWFIHASD
jgi:hypothetical protein